MPATIKCKDCEAAGTKYTLRWGGMSPRTMMAFYPFVDDQGRRHYHDGNSGGGEYWCCSNGHTVCEEEGPSCWCGWPLSGEYAEADRKMRADYEAKRAALKRDHG